MSQRLPDVWGDNCTTQSVEGSIRAAWRPTRAAWKPNWDAWRPTWAARRPTWAVRRPTRATWRPTLAARRPTWAAQRLTWANLGPLGLTWANLGQILDITELLFVSIVEIDLKIVQTYYTKCIILILCAFAFARFLKSLIIATLLSR